MDSVTSLQERISAHPAVFAYFTAPDCSVCGALEPKLRAAIGDAFESMEFVEVDVSQAPRVSAEFGVFAVPTVLVFLDGNEFVRKTRGVHVDELVATIRRPYDLLMS